MHTDADAPPGIAVHPRDLGWSGDPGAYGGSANNEPVEWVTVNSLREEARSKERRPTAAAADTVVSALQADCQVICHPMESKVFAMTYYCCLSPIACRQSLVEPIMRSGFGHVESE